MDKKYPWLVWLLNDFQWLIRNPINNSFSTVVISRLLEILEIPHSFHQGLHRRHMCNIYTDQEIFLDDCSLGYHVPVLLHLKMQCFSPHCKNNPCAFSESLFCEERSSCLRNWYWQCDLDQNWWKVSISFITVHRSNGSLNAAEKHMAQSYDQFTVLKLAFCCCQFSNMWMSKPCASGSFGVTNINNRQHCALATNAPGSQQIR